MNLAFRAHHRQSTLGVRWTLITSKTLTPLLEHLYTIHVPLHLS